MEPCGIPVESAEGQAGWVKTGEAAADAAVGIDDGENVDGTGVVSAFWSAYRASVQLSGAF